MTLCLTTQPYCDSEWTRKSFCFLEDYSQILDRLSLGAQLPVQNFVILFLVVDNLNKEICRSNVVIDFRVSTYDQLQYIQNLPIAHSQYSMPDSLSFALKFTDISLSVHASLSSSIKEELIY